MKIRMGIGFMIVVLATMAFPHVAAAHSTETAGSVSITLHDAPSDNPIVDIPQQFLFIFHDEHSLFSVANCHCSVRIVGPQTDYVTMLQSQSAVSAMFTYTFAQAGQYTLSLTARPISNNSFVPFTSTYSIKVSPTNSMHHTSPTDVYIQLLGLVSVILLVPLLVFKHSKQQLYNRPRRS